MTQLKAGDAAPNFSALDEQGNTISLGDYKGKKLVVFFYPKASTPGCTAEACNLNDNFDEFKSKKSWSYTFDTQTVHFSELESIKVAANDKYGNTEIIHVK